MDPRQFSPWCASDGLAHFDDRRVYIECYDRGRQPLDRRAT
jgi:hypothetical protein